MRIAFLTFGTRGDVQPVLAIGDALRQRGHSVVLMVNHNLVDWARRSGLEVVATGPDTEAHFKSSEGRRMLARGDLLAFSREYARLEREANRELIDASIRTAAGADLVVSMLLTAYRGHCLSAATGVRHRVLTTMPVLPTGELASLLFGGRDLGARWLNRASADLMWWIWWRNQRALIHDTCRALGVAPFGRRPPVEDTPGMHVFSEHLFPRPTDWPAQHEVVGFQTLSPSLRHRLGEGRVPADLNAWLDRGPPPVFFGFGSMPVLDPGAMLHDVIELTRRRGMRALIGAGWSELNPGGEALPEHVHIAGAFDHDRVLPRCAAAVHHGGAGTTAAALRAGLPSLIASVFGDQPFWGRRVTALGVGTTMRFRALNPRRLDRALEVLVDPDVRRRAAALGARIAAEPAVEQAADLVERWLDAPARHLGAARRAA